MRVQEAGGKTPGGSRPKVSTAAEPRNQTVDSKLAGLELNQLEGGPTNSPGPMRQPQRTFRATGRIRPLCLNGTLSRNLQQVGGDPNEGWDRAASAAPARADFQQGVPGINQQGGLGGRGGGVSGPGGGGSAVRGGGGFGGPWRRRRPWWTRWPSADTRDGADSTAAPIGNRRNRGQQRIHGLVNVVLHNSYFDAKPFSLNGQDVPKPDYSQERFSFQIGGPLMIPKLFRLANTTFASTTP